MNDRQAVWARYPDIRINTPNKNPHGLYAVWLTPQHRHPLVMPGDSILTIYRLLRQMIEWEISNVRAT